MVGFKKKFHQKKTEAKWSGTITFHQKKTGLKIVRDEWWMIATITNNFGNGLDSSIFQNTDGDKARCATNGKTELSLGLDEQTGDYDMSVDIPGCYGLKTDRYGKTDSFGLCDETAIVIERQRTSPNPNALKGTIRVVDGPDASGYTVITTHEWDLKKVK
jgi:hypothetical protein